MRSQQLLPGLRGADPALGQTLFHVEHSRTKRFLLFSLSREAGGGARVGPQDFSSVPSIQAGADQPHSQPFRLCLCSPGQKIPWISGSSVTLAPRIHMAPSRCASHFSRSPWPCTSFKVLSDFIHFCTQVRKESPGVLSQGKQSKIPL